MASNAPSILLVDDDLDICRNLSDILTDLDFSVDVANDGETALQKIGETRFDLVLLDLKMPGMNGLSVYRHIKQTSTSTLAILITGYADRDTVDEATREGLVHILNKPVQVPRLFEVVNELLDRPLVMVVDDDLELCNSLCDVLRDRGFRVVIAHDQSQAADELQHRSFDVVLIDMKLPEGDGRGVFELVRQCDARARTVLITGHREEMEPLVSSVIQEGADAICYKPFQVERLLDTIQCLTPGRR